MKPSSSPRWAPREQTDRASAPQTAAFPGLGSGHEEEASRRGRATTAATRHPEAEDGPSGELTPGRLCSDTVGRALHLHTLHPESLFAWTGEDLRPFAEEENWDWTVQNVFCSTSEFFFGLELSCVFLFFIVSQEQGKGADVPLEESLLISI